ncbi:MAG: zinc metalloprotease HtpX [Legionellaceae bacterium]|nr:zinc metalloprotease HtpX [Legionellaceae bacterium]
MNNIKTFALMAGMTALLLIIGGATGGRGGVMISLMLAGLMNFGAYWFSDQIVLKMYKAEPLPKNHIVSKMLYKLARRAGIPTPKPFILKQSSPNAFATGRNPEHASIAVTQGLLSLLTEDELYGVLAHEMSHVLHRDTLISTVSATIAGAISGIVNLFMWTNILGGHGDERRVNPFVSMLIMMLAPMAASLIQFAISRSREFEADAGSAKLTGSPSSLASALMKLERYAKDGYFSDAETHPASAHLFIINPLRGEKLTALFRTHPLTDERVQRLNSMDG